MGLNKQRKQVVGRYFDFLVLLCFVSFAFLFWAFFSDDLLSLGFEFGKSKVWGSVEATGMAPQIGLCRWKDGWKLFFIFCFITTTTNYYYYY